MDAEKTTLEVSQPIGNLQAWEVFKAGLKYSRHILRIMVACTGGHLPLGYE
jgi:hypothetical protein